MLIKVHARGFKLSKGLQDYCDSKIRLALSIYKNKILRTDIFLSDINGPKGGEDMVCKIKVKPDRQSPIIVQETSEDLYEAISVCAHRVKRVANRQFDRETQKRKVSSFERAM